MKGRDKLNSAYRFDRQSSFISIDESEASIKAPVLRRILHRMVSPRDRRREPTNRKQSQLQTYVDELARSRGFSTNIRADLLSSYSARPTTYQKVSYGEAISLALRQKSRADTLESLFITGISPNPYDVDKGEYLVHTICSMGNFRALQTVLEYGGSNVIRCVDVFGRTPLHCVCWKNKNSILPEQQSIVKTLLKYDAQMAYVPDCNGALPLSYIPECQFSAWMSFFDSNKDNFWPTTTSFTKHCNEMVVSVCKQKKLTPEMAQMISSGKMAPEEVELFCYNEQFKKSDVEKYILPCDLPLKELKRQQSETEFSEISDLLFDDMSFSDAEQDVESDNSNSIFDEDDDLAEILSCISKETVLRIKQRLDSPRQD